MPGGVNTYILEGRVVTMNAASDVLDAGRVYVSGPRIETVAPVGDPAPDGYADAPVVRTGGTIYPGLIELHNHLPYNVLPMWPAPRQYTNRGQWGSANASYRALVSGPMGVLGRVAGYIEAVVRYVEVKALLGGVTTSQGIALYSNANRRIYHGLVRNVEQPGAPDLPRAESRVADVDAQFAGAFLERLRQMAGRTLLLHLSEGVDDVARAHFRALRSEDGQWAITDALAGIHCTGLRGRDFATFRSRGGTMVWSPLSNLLLYGATTDIARAVRERLVIGLGSDWSPSGSKNLLGEMKVAWLVAQQQDAGLTPRDIVAMATINGARILKWNHALGSIEPGKIADLIVVSGRGGDPYEHLLRARETSIALVVIDGHARYGQVRTMQRLAGTGERFAVGGAARTIDLTDAATDPIVGALSLADARDRLTDGMRRLPELAQRLEQPDGAEALTVGASSAEDPGTSWFLELDHEPLPGFSVRPQLPIDGVATGVIPEAFLAAPLSEVVQPVDLDPLTVADDRRFFDRLAEARNLPAYVVRELPPLYGQRPREPVPPVAVAEVPTAEGADQPVPLAEFVATAESVLSPAERRLLVNQAIVLLEQCYVHLQLKRAMHAVEPIQRLRLLRYRLDQPEGAAMTDHEFHRELLSIFALLHDLHTNYVLPSWYRNRTAFLPFLVEEYFDDGSPHYVVTKVLTEFEPPPDFVPGVNVLHWNGVPIRRAIAINAEVQGGSNRAAAWARGLHALTVRPMIRSLPPDEEWVTVTYQGMDEVTREARMDWRIGELPQGLGAHPDSADLGANEAALGYDIETDGITQALKVLFARPAYDIERVEGPVAARPIAVDSQLDEPTSLPTVLRARKIITSSGTYGYMRIFTFMVGDVDAFVSEFCRLASLLPQDGLILDVRRNGGGVIHAAERLLQVLTPKVIDPSPAQFVTTPLMLDVCERNAPSPLIPQLDLAAWIPSMRQSVTTGAVYSQAVPITDAESANSRGQVYQGPVVLIADALCYSATDMFVAGFADHQIGTILGVADNTGAGGANVWTHDLLRRLMDAPHPQVPAYEQNPFRELPRGAGMRVSVRRTTRVGALVGTPLEDLGVDLSGCRHHMTRRDVLGRNEDLLDRAGELLKATPSHRLKYRVELTAEGELDFSVEAMNIDLVDVFVDGRPAGWFRIDGVPTVHRTRPPSGTANEVELRCYTAGRLSARARTVLGN